MGLQHSNRLSVSATLIVKGNKKPSQCTALIDSGSEQNLIQPDLVKQKDIPIFELTYPISDNSWVPMALHP